MALTKVSGGILDPGIDVAGIVTATGFDGPFVGGSSKNITAGTVTATELDINGNGDISGNLVVGGNLTANGDFTTLNTTLREVELLRVESNSSAVAGIITQSGSGDILKLYDSSTPVFVVKDGGRVGIGTDNPTAELDIEGASARIHLHDFDHNQSQIIQQGDSLYLNVDSEGNGSGTLRIRVGGNDAIYERLRIASNGNVGLGTNNPATELHVQSATPEIRLQDSDGTDQYSQWKQVGGNARLQLRNGNNNGSFTIQGLGGGTATDPFVRVQSDGKVGIGTDNPARDFHVTGTSRFEQLDVVGFSTFATGTRFFHHTPQIYMQGSNTATLSFVNATTGTTASTDGMLMGFSSSSQVGFINVNEASHGFVLKTGGTAQSDERIRVSGVGTVSIRSGTEEMVNARPNFGVGLYFNGNKRLETTTTGVDITDNLNVTGIATGTIFKVPDATNVNGATNHIAIGDNSDLKLYHDNNGDAQIFNSTGHLTITNNTSGKVINLQPKSGANGIIARYEGAAELYHNGNLRLNTTPQGINVTTVGDVPQVSIAQTTTGAYSINGTLSFVNSNNTTAQIQGRTGAASTTGDIIFLCNSVGDETLAVLEDGKVRVPDRGRFVAGSGNDLQIYHSNSDNNSYITESGSGDLLIKATQIKLQDASGSDYLRGFTGGAVYLHNAGATKFETTSTGVHVTGEIATSQDYPTFRPTLDLNFASSQKLDRRVTYTRSGPASYVNEFGKIVLVGDNAPRFDYGYEYVNTNSYKLTNSESKGVLIESQKTNLVSYSIYDGDKSGTAQTSSGDTGNWDLTLGHATFTGGIDAPDGSNDAVRFTALNTGFSLLRIPIPAFTPNGSDDYTLSFYARGISGTGNVTCDLHDGAPMLENWNNQMITNEWVRIVVTGVPTDESRTFIDLISNSNTNRVIDFWGVQLEQGSFPSSFIPTRGAIAIRGIDLLTIEGEEFTEFYNQTEGSIVSEIMLPPSWPESGFASITLTLSDNSYNNRITLASSTGSAAFNADVSISGSTTRASLGSYTSGTHSIKAAMAYKASDSGGSLNGAAAVTTSPSGTLPLLTRADIGKDHNNGNPLNGHIKRIMYYSKRLSNNQLRTLTS